MARIVHESDASLQPLAGQAVAVFGYEGLGRAQALNLRDSGVRVVVAEPADSAPARRAEAEGMARVEPAEAAHCAQVLVLAVPDSQQGAAYRSLLAPTLRPGQTLVLPHGFAISSRQVRPPAEVDVVLVAPKVSAELLRHLYVERQGAPCLVAVHQDASGRALGVALACARAVSGAGASLVEVSSREATEAHLFSEQAVGGGVAALVVASFETLLETGYAPEVAYLECVQALRRVAELLFEQGLVGMRERLGERAAYGEVTRGPRVVDTRVRGRLCELLREVQDGRFAREWMLEVLAGGPLLRMLEQQTLAHPLEEVGRRVREMMPWLGQPKAVEPPAALAGSSAPF